MSHVVILYESSKFTTMNEYILVVLLLCLLRRIKNYYDYIFSRHNSPFLLNFSHFIWFIFSSNYCDVLIVFCFCRRYQQKLYHARCELTINYCGHWRVNFANSVSIFVLFATRSSIFSSVYFNKLHSIMFISEIWWNFKAISTENSIPIPHISKKSFSKDFPVKPRGSCGSSVLLNVCVKVETIHWFCELDLDLRIYNNLPYIHSYCIFILW